MQKYTSIILSSHDAGEFDRFYLMYTFEKGLIRVVGRGVRKPTAKLAGHLEPGTLSEVYIARSRGFGQIASAITIETYPGIKNRLEILQATLAIFKFFSKIFREEAEDKNIFLLLEEFLKLLSENAQGGQSKILLLGFWWKLFDLLGQKPQVVRCANCQKILPSRKKKFFDFRKGGIVCAECSKKPSGLFQVSDNQIKLLRLFFSKPLGFIMKIKAADQEIQDLERIRKEYINYYFS